MRVDDRRGTEPAFVSGGNRRNETTIMQTFSPELAPRWLEGLGPAIDDAHEKGEVMSPAQQETLEALADRISAARAIA
jgi:hypothetical protein